MEEEMIEQIKKQHIDNYRAAILEIVYNNTKMLVDDMRAFIEKPPLDSMDFIQSKFLDLAKKNHIVFNRESLSGLIADYRDEFLNCCDMIQMMRIHALSSKIEKFDFNKGEVFTFYKKDFIEVNKEIRKVLKELILISYEEKILKNIDSVFQENIEEDIRKDIIQEVTKYMKGNYQKQIIEGFDIKVLVKDTILMNGVKEQGERYLFTLENSRLLNL